MNWLLSLSDFRRNTKTQMKGTEAAWEPHQNDGSCGKWNPKWAAVLPLDNEWYDTMQAHEGWLVI